MATKNLGALVADLGLDNKQFLVGAAQSKAQLLGLSKSLSSLAVPALVIGGTIALVRGISKATDAAAKLEKSMANVATLVDKPKEEISALTKEIQEMTTEVLKSSTDLSAGLYQVFSAGITESAEAMEVLRVSAVAATAGLSDTRTSVDAITTVLNAYQLEAQEATRVSDILFQTVRLGKTTYEELAGAIGTVIPIAATAGVELEDLFATIATLTKGGIQTRRATTALRSALLAVIKPSEGALQKAKELGLEFSSAAIRAKGFIGFLNDIREKTAGSDEAIAALIPNARALSGVMAAVGKQNAELNRIQEEFTDISGSTAEAFRKQADTVEEQSNRMGLEFDKLREKLGRELLGPKKTFITFIADSLAELNKQLIKSSKIAREAQESFSARRNISLLGPVSVSTITKSGEIKTLTEDLFAAQEATRKQINNILGGFNIINSKIPTVMEKIIQSFGEFPSVFGNISDSILKETKTITEKVITEWNKVPDSIKKAFEDLGIVPQAQFEDIVKNTVKSFELVGRELDKRGELNAETAVKLRQKLIDKLKGISTETAKSGFIIDDEQIKQLEQSLGEFGESALRTAQEVTREINQETGALELTIKKGVFEVDKFIADTAIEAINSFKDVGLDVNNLLKDNFSVLADSHVQKWTFTRNQLTDLDISYTDSFLDELKIREDGFDRFANRVQQRAISMANSINAALEGTVTPPLSVPVKYHRGTLSVPKTGLAQVERGELILSAEQNPFNDNRRQINNFNIQGDEVSSTDVVREVVRSMRKQQNRTF